MEGRTTTGAEVLDELLEGGYENDAVTTIYGPAGAGKTNLALLAAVSTALKGKKVVYIDTEGGFSAARLGQIASNPKKILGKIMFLKPTNFDEQKKAFARLKGLRKGKIGLIVVDTIAMHYRLQKSNEDVHEVNRDLGVQIGILNEICRKQKIPVVITNQVYSEFATNRVNMVGGDILKYGSKCLLELQPLASGWRKIVLRKHRSIAGEKEALFQIIDKGISGK